MIDVEFFKFSPSSHTAGKRSADSSNNMTLTVFGSPRPVLSVNSWIIIQNKVPQGESSVSFNQTWLAYRNGFGDLTMTSNYWIGNEVIYGLVSTGNYKLRVEVNWLIDE
jgi:hypothetical protein